MHPCMQADSRVLIRLTWSCLATAQTATALGAAGTQEETGAAVSGGGAAPLAARNELAAAFRRGSGTGFALAVCSSRSVGRRT